MSTLNVNTVQSSTSNPPIFKNSGGDVAGTLCRAWVNFDGTGTVAIRDSFNVSSITDNGTGNYTVNFTNAMANSNYSAVCGQKSSSSLTYVSEINSQTSSSIQLVFFNYTNGSALDQEIVNLVVFAN